MSDHPHHDFSDFPRIAAAVAAYRAGQPVLLLDDSDRENEADIVAAAENLSLDTMVKMIRDGSGIVCVCFLPDDVDALGLRQMVENNQSKNHTGFTVSIEAATGVTTGVSAADRLVTIESAMGALDGTAEIVSPGHIFPLRASRDGVLDRRGHTEGSIDIARADDDVRLHPIIIHCATRPGSASPATSVCALHAILASQLAPDGARQTTTRAPDKRTAAVLNQGAPRLAPRVQTPRGICPAPRTRTRV